MVVGEEVRQGKEYRTAWVNMAAVLIYLLGWTAAAKASETLCRAVIHMIDGSQVEIKDVAAQGPDVYSLPQRFFKVRTEYAERDIYLDRLRSLSRISPSKNLESNNLICFAYEGEKVLKGRFWVDPQIQIVGRTKLGSWRSPLSEIKSLNLECPKKFDLSPPVPDSLPRPNSWPF